MHQTVVWKNSNNYAIAFDMGIYASFLDQADFANITFHISTLGLHLVIFAKLSPQVA
jgi:hypothetical protein